jgi:GLPGLI family protein
MKKTIIILTYLFLNVNYGQTIVVNYDQIFINQNINLFKNYDLIIKDSLSIYIERESNVNEKENFIDETNKSYNLLTNYKTESNLYYKNMKGFKFSETFFSKRIVVQEEENLGDWVFYDTIKKIGDYDCKLAVKNFRGRKYHVWYTNDIQTLYGPWKFYGLSGLILHAYDESKEFEIQAKSIKFIERDKESIYTDLINNSVIFFNSNKSITINELKKHIEDNNEIILNNIRKQLPRGVELPNKLDDDCKDCGSLEVY